MKMWIIRILIVFILSTTSFIYCFVENGPTSLSFKGFARKNLRIYKSPEKAKEELEKYLKQNKGAKWQVLKVQPDAKVSTKDNSGEVGSYVPPPLPNSLSWAEQSDGDEPFLVSVEEFKGYVKAVQYLQNDVRLGADQLERVYIGSIIASDFSKEKLKDRVSGIRKALGVRKEQLSEVLNQNPMLLSKDLDALVSLKSTELAHMSGFTKAQARKVVLGIPELLSGEIDKKLLRNRLEGFKQHLNWTVSDVGNVAASFPQVILANFDRALLPFDHYFRGSLNLTSTQVVKLAQSCPRLITFKVKRLQQTESFLKRRLGASNEILKKIIVENPFVFSYEIDDMLEPVIAFFETKLEMSSYQICKMLSVYPHLLSLDVKDKLLPRVDFLLKDVGLKKKSLVKVLLAHPQTLAYRTDENIKPKLMYFQSALGMSKDQTKKMIADYPQLLSLSMENNIKKKVQVFEKKLGISKEYLSHVIASNPSMLSCSIQHRILPRIKQMESSGINPSAKCILPLTKYPDRRFQSWLQDKL